jgi:hypothetical protein
MLVPKRKPKKTSLDSYDYETAETRKLSNTELQRLVLLEQLDYIRAKKKSMENDKFHCDDCLGPLFSRDSPGPLLRLIFFFQDRGGYRSWKCRKLVNRLVIFCIQMGNKTQCSDVPFTQIQSVTLLYRPQ